MEFEYTDGGYVNTTFIVGEQNPQTFDGIMTYIILGFISLGGIFSIIMYSKRKSSIN